MTQLKLQCLRPTQSLTLDLLDELPNMSTLDFNDCNTVYEDAQYKAYLACNSHSPSDISNVTVMLNGRRIGKLLIDYSQPYLYGSVIFDIEIRDKPFLLQCDLAVLSFQLNFIDNTRKVLYSGFLLCVSKDEENAENIRNIVETLIEFDNSQVLQQTFSSNNTQSNKSIFSGCWYQHTYRSLSSYVQLIEEISIAYNKNFTFFKAMGKHTIETTTVLSPYEKVRTINGDSFQWLMQNSDQLAIVSGKSGISYNGKNYLPLMIKDTVTQKSWDVYENHIIIDFLVSVLQNAQSVYKSYNTQIINENRIVERLNGSVPRNYRASIITVKTLQVAFYSNLLKKLGDVIAQIKKVYILYMSVFNFPGKPLKGIPRKTKTFQEIRPYIQLFEIIYRWFNYGEFSSVKDNLLLQVKTLDKLFEYFCLLKILDATLAEGYISDSSTQSACKYLYTASDDLYQNEVDMANTYNFIKGDILLTVYYQPLVSATGLQNGITLYRTTIHRSRNHETGDWQIYDYYTPDFILKFKNLRSNQVEYVVLDSKFSTRETIKYIRMPEVIQKYSNEFSSVENGKSPAMVWILQGRVREHENLLWHYHNSPLARQYTQQTSYGIVAVNSRRDASHLFWTEIKKQIPWA